MNGSNHLAETDAQPLSLCPVCLRKLQWSTGFDVVKRAERLRRIYVEASFTNPWRGLAWVLSRDEAAAATASPQAQKELQALVNARHRLGGEPANARPKEAPVGCYDLRDVDDRCYLEASLARWYENVAGHFGKSDVRCDHRGKYCGDAALVEGICLNDKEWARAARRGRDRIGKVGPPDVASSYFHSSFEMERA